MIRSLLSSGGATKCRTIDKLDIFGDGSCKALYRLDGNANDESGNYHGTETAITYGGGVYERGAIFNASSSYITNSVTKTSLLNGYSISMWVLHSDINTNSTLIAESNVNKSLIEITRLSSNLISYKMYTDGSSSKIMSLSSLPYSPTINTYYHYVFQFDGTTNTNGIKIYINGVLNAQGTASLTASNIGNITGMFIGRRYDGLYHSGSIDQIRIFNRALTVQEVATLYAECEPTSIVDNINPFEDGSLKALYKFDNDATDATGVHNGTATNVTYASGKFGNCAVFNGTSSVVETTMTQIPSLISVSCWINLNNITANSDIVGTATSISYAIGWNVSVSNSLLYLLGSSNGSSFTTLYSTPFSFLNNWVHIVVTSNNGTVKMYINGTPVVVTIHAGGIPSIGAGVFKIGTRGTSTIHGSIDQVRIFNKALTPLEVASLYNETTPMEEPMSVRVDPFKDGSGKALYRLDGNALDESGNYNGTPTSVNYVSGRFGRCFVGNSVSSQIKVTGDFDSADWAISCWCKLNATTPSADKYLFSPNGGNGLYSILNPAGTTNLTWAMGASLRTITNGLNDTNWHHYAMSLNGITASLYKDGVLIDSITQAVTRTDSGLTIGANRNVNSTESWNGLIEQVRIFNRALTQSEVTALYNEI